MYLTALWAQLWGSYLALQVYIFSSQYVYHQPAVSNCQPGALMCTDRTRAQYNYGAFGAGALRWAHARVQEQIRRRQDKSDAHTHAHTHTHTHTHIFTHCLAENLKWIHKAQLPRSVELNVELISSFVTIAHCIGDKCKCKQVAIFFV